MSDPIDLMPQLIEKAHTEGAKTILALTHIGSRHDIELAEKVPGIDIIIGGHDHKRINPPMVVNNTLIVQAGEYGQMLGRLDLAIDSDSGKVIGHTASLIPIDEVIPEDAGVLAAVNVENRLIDEMMHQKIGEIQLPLSVSDDKRMPGGKLAG